MVLYTSWIYPPLPPEAVAEDHKVPAGVSFLNGEPAPNPEEVDDWMWIDLEGLREDIRKNPDRYTYWLRRCIDQVVQHLAVSASTEC